MGSTYLPLLGSITLVRIGLTSTNTSLNNGTPSFADMALSFRPERLTKTSEEENARAPVAKRRISDHAAANIPGPVVGLFRLCPRKDDIYVKMVDIMQPFRRPATEHELSEPDAQTWLGPDRPARDFGVELKGIGDQFDTGVDAIKVCCKRKRGQ